jgi:phage head maturation protease
LTQFNPSETFVRADSVVADIDVKQRLIDLIAVPWDQEAEVPWRGEVWHEVFRRGSFDGLADHAGRVLVTRDHKEPPDRGDVVGKLVYADPKHNDGLFARAKIAATLLGDETLALAEEDMVRPSVGYRIKSPTDVRLDRRLRMREVLRAFLDHLSLVGYPAYSGAQVLAVREEQPGLTEAPPSGALAIDEAFAHPAYLQALERLTHQH